MKLFIKSLSIAIISSLIAVGCVQQRNQQADTQEETNFTKAVAKIHPLDGDTPSGTVTFVEDSSGIVINATVSGLDTESKHGFHIHKYGDCTAEDGTSAGGHYAPDSDRHGEPGVDTHDGDLGNLVTDSEGNGTVNFTSKDIVLNGPKSIIGRGIIIHAGADDMESQPSGAAGPRIACGVIGIANDTANGQN